MAEKLFKYQIEGAQWLATRERAGLYDEMGVGKTATLIHALDLTGAKRILVVAPAIIRDHWVREFRRFSQRPLRVCKGQSIHDYVAWFRNQYDVLVTSYEFATKWTPYIHRDGVFIEGLVLDESHYLKSTKTKRTKVILGISGRYGYNLCSWAVRAWMATGTPIPNDPLDIYAFLRFVKATNFSRDRFIREYFNVRRLKYNIRTTVKPEKLQDLRRMISAHAIRRKRDDLGISLRIVTTLISGDTMKVTNLLKEHPNLELAVIRALREGTLDFNEVNHISTLRRLVGLAKGVTYAKMLHDDLIKGVSQKRVVYGYHRQVLLNLQQFLEKRGLKSVLIQGDTPERYRGQAIDSFQSDPRCRVFIGNLRSAGVGITLTAASELDILESDWSPANNIQAIKRIHRIGQKKNVIARFITLANSIDEKVNEVVAKKARAIASISEFSD